MLAWPVGPRPLDLCKPVSSVASGIAAWYCCIMCIQYLLMFSLVEGKRLCLKFYILEFFLLSWVRVREDWPEDKLIFLNKFFSSNSNLIVNHLYQYLPITQRTRLVIYVLILRRWNFISEKCLHYWKRHFFWINLYMAPIWLITVNYSAQFTILCYS